MDEKKISKMEKVEKREISDELKESYLDYAMSVIVSRALPDVRDGLKPVHRRILWTMWEDGLTHSAKFRKSANVVGAVLGRYHPHGDSSVYDAMVRMAQDFSLRYPLIQGQGNFGCFTKDTKIKLTDGRNLNFEELINEEKRGKKNYSFTFNQKTQQIEIAEIKKPRLTRKNEKIIEITLDNGEKIKCTLDHRFMLRDGTYKQAKDLKTKDSLMPLYTKLCDGKIDLNLKGYEMIYQPIKNIWEFIHRLADEWNLKNKIYKKSAGRIRHHKDFNKLNNNPGNILRIRKERINNGVPKIENVFNYFTDFSGIVIDAQKRNHKIIKTRILRKREDVYDLTIEPWHNFALAAGVFVHNSVDGDGPAAYRYTESRLSKPAEELLFDVEKETVDWQSNYDGVRQEPKVLPARLPNLLLNGSFGIAVGMATEIPPHNLNEVVDALVYLIDRPKTSVEELTRFIQGPDFPTGGIIYDKKAITEAYASGKGPITCRALAEIEERKPRPKSESDSGRTGQFNIIITEIPYRVNKSELIIKIAELVQEKKIEGIRDLRDESDREGMRIVVELKNDANPQKILNQLYKHTDLQKDFHLNMIALIDNGIQPQLLSLKEILEAYLEQRKIVIERRAKFDLNKAKERAHILEGLVKALSVIDKIVSAIKKSKDRSDAHQNLVKNFKLTDIQAGAILDMRLSALAALERQKIEDELKEKRKLIGELEALLKSPAKILNVVKNELLELKKIYGDERKTKVIASGLKEFKEEDLIAQEEVIINLSRSGYIKRVSPSAIRIQHRGGKGLIGSELAEEDFISHFISADTHDNILFFTDKGRVFQTKVYEIPAGSRTSKGKLVQNFLEIPAEEKISAIIAYAVNSQKSNINSQRFLVMATKKGIIKKTSVEDFANVRRSGIIAINLQKGDELKWVKLSSGKEEIILATAYGQAIRFKESQLRPMGRTAAGVKAIKLKKAKSGSERSSTTGDDFVAGIDIIKTSEERKVKSEKLLVVMENGFAKQTPLKAYKIQSRGGSGVKTAKITSKTGKIVAAQIIADEEELLALSNKGQIIKTKISDIRTAGRATSGVRVMRLKEGDKVAGIVIL